MRTQWDDGLGLIVLWGGKRNLFFHSWREEKTATGEAEVGQEPTRRENGFPGDSMMNLRTPEGACHTHSRVPACFLKPYCPKWKEPELTYVLRILPGLYPNYPLCVYIAQSTAQKVESCQGSLPGEVSLQQVFE